MAGKLLSVVLVLCATVRAADTPTGAPSAGSDPTAKELAVLVKSLTSVDLPAPEPPDAWNKAGSVMGNNNLALAVLDKWVYVASQGSYRILQLERCPRTATLTYRNSLPMPSHEDAAMRLATRRLPDGNGTLYLWLRSDACEALYWYAIDGQSGALKEKGNVKTAFDRVALLWSPGQTQLYAVGSGGRLTWYRLADDGKPVEEASFDGKEHGRHGGALLSPDGRHLYIAARDDTGDANGRVDVYDRDEKSGKLAYNSSLALSGNPVSKKGETPCLAGISPDGRHLYVTFWEWDDEGFLYVLGRSTENGKLSVLSAGKPDPNVKGAQAFAFNTGGKSGYFYILGRIGWCGRDPASGALTYVGGGNSAHGSTHSDMVLDVEAGNLLVCGTLGVKCFKTPAANDSARPTVTRKYELQLARAVAKDGKEAPNHYVKNRPGDIWAVLLAGTVKDLPSAEEIAAARVILPLVRGSPKNPTLITASLLRAAIEPGKPYRWADLGDRQGVVVVSRQTTGDYDPPREFPVDVTFGLKAVATGEAKFFGFAVEALRERFVDQGEATRVDLPDGAKATLEVDVFSGARK